MKTLSMSLLPTISRLYKGGYITKAEHTELVNATKVGLSWDFQSVYEAMLEKIEQRIKSKREEMTYEEYEYLSQITVDIRQQFVAWKETRK